MRLCNVHIIYSEIELINFYSSLHPTARKRNDLSAWGVDYTLSYRVSRLHTFVRINQKHGTPLVSQCYSFLSGDIVI